MSDPIEGHEENTMKEAMEINFPNEVMEDRNSNAVEESKDLNNPTDKDTANSSAVPLSKSDILNGSSKKVSFCPNHLSSLVNCNYSTETAVSISQALPKQSKNDVLATSSSQTGFNPQLKNTSSVAQDTKKLKLLFPQVHQSKIYTMLMKERCNENRLDVVSVKLLELESANTECKLVNGTDCVLKDVEKIMKDIPNADNNKVYALVASMPPRQDRVQRVISLIIKDMMGYKEQTDGAQCLELTSAGMPIQEEVERLTSLFPDCDPNYLFERLESLKDRPERCHILAIDLFENKDYPKLRDVLAKPKKEIPNESESKLQEFLEKFPDPLQTFTNEDEEVSDTYLQNAFLTLKNEFLMIESRHLRNVLTKHSNHFLPSYQELRTYLAHFSSGNEHLTHVRALCPLPSESDEYFNHELWYTHNQQRVQDYKKRKEIRQRKIIAAREKGELYECCCCYDDECLFEDLASCPEGHLFCKVCIMRSTEAAFGEMKTEFLCLTGECDQFFQLSTLQSIVPPVLFSKILRRIQEEEVQRANIPDLVTCPFCPFATIMPNMDDKVLKCLNPECFKESCRLCCEENHVPLKCNEVETEASTNMRTFIENYIADAVIRKCHECGKKFVKDSGCNKMTCICGATSCYACKKEDIGYEHFHHNKKCANTDPETIHQQDMKKAAFEARDRYLHDHPEAKDVELDENFMKWVQSLSTNL